MSKSDHHRLDRSHAATINLNMNTSPTYGTAALETLSEQTAYEAWLLEAVYSIVEQELFPTWDEDAIVYPLGAQKPKIYGFGRANINIGDWRPGFLNAGAPLVFVATFKLLDMLMEWVLEANGLAANHRFEQKLRHLGTSLAFPPSVETRPWLKDRLIGLYRTLEPFRGTIIHGSHFTSADGAIHVSSSKKGIIGPTEVIDAAQLRRLALSVVSVLRYVSGAWPMDHYREKVLRHDLDELGSLHGLASLGQKKPHHVSARVYVEGTDPTTFDASLVSGALATTYSDHDCSFDLRLLMVVNGKLSTAYEIPWAVLERTGLRWAERIDDLEKYQASVPDEIPGAHLVKHD